MNEKKLLGEETVVEYVANRLKFDTVTTHHILQKHPAVFKVRVTKIKEILDYLIHEAKFTNSEIASNIRILCHSLKTTKQRIFELASHGCRPSSLVIVCKSSNEYQKFLNNWLLVRQNLMNNNVIDIR